VRSARLILDEAHRPVRIDLDDEIVIERTDGPVSLLASRAHRPPA
jgi:hypothetical protein